MKVCKMHFFFMSSALDRSKRLPWLTARHLRSCRECRELWAGLNLTHKHLLDAGRELRRQADQSDHERPCPEFDRRPASGPEAVRMFTWSWRPLAGLAAALLLLVVGLRFLPLQPGPEKTSAPELLETNRGQLALLLEARDGRTLESPLEDELHGMINSARLAAEFLAAKTAKTRRLLAETNDWSHEGADAD